MIIQPPRTGVVFVCMGNICRSPTAEGVFRRLAERAGMLERIMVDSAGTHSYHVGLQPDPRAQAAAAQRGYDLSALRARQFSARDVMDFDYVLAMDSENLEEVRRLIPKDKYHKTQLFMNFSTQHHGQDVPDPYYGSIDGFEQVLSMVEDATAGLLAEIRKNLPA
ncbi:MAG: low molecular weight protein-tyrosine-phosphatase [Burkholderiales bacterium]